MTEASLERFKPNDTQEADFISCVLPTLEALSDERDTMYDECYEAYPLGDVLYELDRSPLASVLTKSDFRQSFFAIHEWFTGPGTFEFYLNVFRAIFGADVSVQFITPAAGKLQINIQVLTVETFNILAREIVDNAYVYRPLQTNSGDRLIGAENKGPKTQSEITALIFELSVGGVWTVCTLTL